MKSKKFWIHTVFLALIVLSLVFFCITATEEYRTAEEADDLFGGGFAVLICLLFYFPVFSFEVELYRVVRYFALCPNKRKIRTFINILSLLLVPILFLAAWSIYWFDALHPGSMRAVEALLLLAPVHFVIMRIVAFCWWCGDSDKEISP